MDRDTPAVQVRTYVSNHNRSPPPVPKPNFILQDELNSIKKHIKALSDSLKEEQGKRRGLDKELTLTREIIDGLQKECTDIDTIVVEKLDKELETTKARHEEEISQIKEQISALKADAGARKAEMEREARLAVEKELGSLKATIVRQQEDVKTACERVLALERKSKEDARVLMNTQKEFVDTKRKMEEEEEARKTLERKHTELQKTQKTLKEESEKRTLTLEKKMEEERKTSKTEIEFLKANNKEETTKLRKDLTDARAKWEADIKTQERELVASKIETNKLREKVKVLENEMRNLRTDLMAGKSREDEFGKRLDKVKTKIKTTLNLSPSIRDFSAFPKARRTLDIDTVYKQELVNIGDGVRVSKPVAVGKELRSGGCVFIASISHNGVVSIYSFNGTYEECKAYNYVKGEKKNVIQFTDLNSTKQVDMIVEHTTLVGFYNNSMILLTWEQPLREATVESVFDTPTLDVFKKVGSVDGVEPFADVSLLHSTRVLYHRDTSGTPHQYNVDTHINTKLDIDKNVYSFAGMTGISIGVKAIFEESGGDEFSFILNRDNTITKIEEKQYGSLKNFLPSSTCPSDIKRGMLKYKDYFIFNSNRIQPITPIKFESNQSLIRIYRDVFLAYDMNTKQWVLIRIMIP